MKLIPKYSYEFNRILNESLSEKEQISNFVSTLSDKDRFFALLPVLEQNIDFIEEKSGFKLHDFYDFYVVRAEKFKSFSEPITIEYSILPEEMLLFLLKEILKVTIEIRFTDELTREQYLNAFVDYFAINGNFNGSNLIKFCKNIHDESLRLYCDVYQLKELDFETKTLKQHIEDLYLS